MATLSDSAGLEAGSQPLCGGHELGNLVEVVSPAGDRVRFTYDARGLLLSRSTVLVAIARRYPVFETTWIDPAYLLAGIAIYLGNLRAASKDDRVDALLRRCRDDRCFQGWVYLVVSVAGFVGVFSVPR